MSYNFIGFKWGDTTAGTSSGVITWSSTLDESAEFSDPAYQQALQDAFDRWEEVASIDFEYVESGGDIVVSGNDLDSLGLDVVGVAYYSITPRVEFDAVSNTSLEFDTTGQFWTPYGGSGSVNFYAVALHEIGHLIGLDHPIPDDTTEVMNQFIAADELGDGDITGAQIIYGADPGDDAPPPPDGPVGLADGSGGGGGGSGGGGGGGGAVLGLLALLLGFLFGGVGAGAAIAAGRVADSDEDDEIGHDHESDMLLSDLIPTVDILDEGNVHAHPVYWGGEEVVDEPILL